MHKLTVIAMGDDAQGVVLKGNPKSPEPIHFRVVFPGGDVEIVRASDGPDADYWVHVRVNDGRGLANPDDMPGRLVDARLDVRDKATSQTDVGDFNNPQLYHLAVRVQPQR